MLVLAIWESQYGYTFVPTQQMAGDTSALVRAEQLFVSRNTVKSHVKNLYRKLEVSSRADAVERAREVGLLPQD